MLANHTIAHRLASREHPQADGLVERMVQTLKNGLRKVLLDKSATEWDLYMPYIAMGYRISKWGTPLLPVVWEASHISGTDSGIGLPQMHHSPHYRQTLPAIATIVLLRLVAAPTGKGRRILIPLLIDVGEHRSNPKFAPIRA